MLAAGQRGLPCVSYTPQQVKHAVCGSGRAEKEQVPRMVQRAADARRAAAARPRRGRARDRDLPRQRRAARGRRARPVAPARRAGPRGGPARRSARDRTRPRRGRGRRPCAERRTRSSSTGGVGYRLAVSAETLRHVPAAGKPVTLHSHLVVRDDALALYGFATEEERDLFLALIGVQSVGPKVALAVLSGGSPRELWRRSPPATSPACRRCPASASARRSGSSSSCARRSGGTRPAARHRHHARATTRAARTRRPRRARLHVAEADELLAAPPTTRPRH